MATDVVVWVSARNWILEAAEKSRLDVMWR